MKALLFLFFTIATPIAVFLTTILYGGISNTVIKEELADAQIYTQIQNYLPNNPESFESSEFETILRKHFTPEYTQTKVEDIIDESYGWITGSSTASPSVSFPEIKEDLLREHPELLSELSVLQNELQKQPLPEGLSDEEALQIQAQMDQVEKNAASLNNFVQNDFSLPLEKNLKGIKDFYTLITIIYPILLVLLILSLVLLGYLNKTLSSRLKWIGSTLLVAGIFGFLAIVFQNVLLVFLTEAVKQSPNEVILMFAPIFVEMMKSFVKTYTQYQMITSIICTITAAILLGAAYMMRKQTTSVLPVRSKKR